MWSKAPKRDAVGGGLRALARSGVLIAVVAPLAVGEIIGLLEWPTSGVADLIVADSRGTGQAVIDEKRVHRTGRPTMSVNPDPLSRPGGKGR